MGDDFKHFTLNEFACKCGKCQNFIRPELVAVLDRARDLAGVPFAINSGFRCPAHNAAVGGAPASSHLKGLAADIATGSNFERRFRILYGLLGAGFDRIGIATGFIHADIDPDKAKSVVWLYR
ncbi:MAG: D-Ala-D-Ala carboxypeptidase family metallohydrolase [Desulfatibacillaceae bacterium]|nr:D-Ala-D-Ala carboxypeptidase family metallohydrolase [Desulfatibacillaceae bacterium]